MPYEPVAVVVPVYNSEGTLAQLARRLEAVLSSRGSAYEIILVNDGSRDGSWDVIRQLAGKHAPLRGINLLRNYGQHNALLCGIRAAKYEVVVTMDDDLQHPPEEIPKLLDELAEGYDVVYGTPQKERHSLWRTLAAQITKLAVQSMLGAETARSISSFRALRVRPGDLLSEYQGPFVSIDVLLTWGTSRFAAVPVRHEPRTVGASTYGSAKLVAHALEMITGFSTLPLRLASLIGFVLTVFGLALLLYVLGWYLIQGSSVPGFSFLASMIAIFSGAQMFALGIIGEYLARMHFRLMNRPMYVIRERVPDGRE